MRRGENEEVIVALEWRPLRKRPRGRHRKYGLMWWKKN